MTAARTADSVTAAQAAYANTGVLAVAVGMLQEPGEPLTMRAAQARSDRQASLSADSGDTADRPFPTASLVKLFIAEEILHRARSGAVALTGDDLARLQVMISSSDDGAASHFWVRFGGGSLVTDVVARYGLTGTAPPADPGAWGETTTTATDLVSFLSRLTVIADPSDARTLRHWMRTATPFGTDGFDQRFGLFAITGRAPAAKQGWMCCVGGNRHVHSVAIVGRTVVVLLSEVPRSDGWDRARAALTAAAAAVAALPAP